MSTLPERWVSEEEQRLHVLVARLSRLDAEHEALATGIAEFSARYRDRLGVALDELLRVQQVVRRLEQLEATLLAEVEEARAGLSRRSRPTSAASSTRAPRDQGDLEAEPLVAPSTAPPGPLLSLKELYRSLARRLHPDLTARDADGVRASALMVKVNAAYAAGDRVRLELLAAEVDAGAEGPSTGEARRTQVEARIASLERLADGVERDLRGLRASATYRRLEDFRRQEERGRDFFHEQLAAMKADAKAMRGKITPAAHRVEEAVRRLNATLMARKASGALAFRRNGAASTRISPEGKRFRDSLCTLARQASWKAAWVIAAFFGEVAGRPPAGLGSWNAWADLHERLRSHPGRAPGFEAALTTLPHGLELGCRVHPEGFRFGIQLRDGAHLAGVAAALSMRPCTAIARAVLEAMGPSKACERCARVTHHVHLHRVRDLASLHAFACASCGVVRETYRAYGRPEGLEALQEQALVVGLVEEQVVRFGGTSVRLQLHPREWDELTAGRLAKLFREHVLAFLSPDLAERLLCVRCDGRWLRASSTIRRGATVTLSFAGGGPPSGARVVARARAGAPRP